MVVSLPHEVNTDVMFRFKFSSNITNMPNTEYAVYSYTRQNIELFIHQHNFDMANINIEYVDAYDIEGHFTGNYDMILEEFIFKSNKNPNETYTVITTDRFIEGAIERVCSDLSNSLIFGTAAIRTDIEIIDKINSLILSLKHVSILDYTALDGDDISTVEYDDSFIYDSLFGDSIQNKPQPITLESYVSYFTSIMIDEYNDIF